MHQHFKCVIHSLQQHVLYSLHIQLKIGCFRCLPLLSEKEKAHLMDFIFFILLYIVKTIIRLPSELEDIGFKIFYFFFSKLCFPL